MNSFMSWIGGKKALRDTILPMFPLYYERYIEVFGGGGWIMFAKPPGNDFEVYNDFNGLLVNLYRCVRDKPRKLMAELQYVLNSREDFELVRNTLARDSSASDVQKAAWFYQLIRYSYASSLDSFGSQPHDMRANFPLIEQAHRRLAKVVVENKDFEKLIRQYDRPVSFFYCDPPYHATESYYKNVGEDGFTKKDHIRLRDALMGIQGKFLLSYNDDEFIRELYDAPGIQLFSTTRINNIKQRYDPNAQFAELLIGNYDLRERERHEPSQMTLFDYARHDDNELEDSE
jgi:DNA adenine methylase